MKGGEAWTEAEAALNRTSHEPTAMMQVSRGALYSYCCPKCSERGDALLVLSTVSSALTCYGGYDFL